MCGLCSSNKSERKQAQHEAAALADSLESMAGYERALASGHVKPHESMNCEQMRLLAHDIIRRLVADYL
jgi:hypothetical protein